MTAAITFVLAGLVVVVAAVALAREADAIAATTGLGRLWIGTLLLAGATSLPELGTDVSAVLMGAPDIAIGDLFGSTMANMLILAVVDLLPPRRGLLRLATSDQGLTVALAIVVNALAAAFFLVPSRWTVLGVAPGSLLIAALYLLGARAVYRNATRDGLPPVPAEEAAPRRARLRRAGLRFAAAAAVLFVATPFFAGSATRLAELTGLGQTFLGTWLVGLATSLPELVASLAAARAGAFDLAVGNLFGSNAFNMLILLPLDVANGPTSIFADASPLHALTGLFGVVLMGLGLAAILYRAQRRFALLEPDSALMVLFYFLALGTLFLHRGG